jgi:hypothetical protein
MDDGCIMAAAWEAAYTAAELDEFRAAWERRGFTVECLSDLPEPWFWHRRPSCPHYEPATKEVTG